MPIYIAPFDDYNHSFNISSSAQCDLLSVYYKTLEGPLGFYEDEKSRIIFRKIVDGSIWYNKSNNDFEIMDENYFLNKTFFEGNGIFMMPTAYVEQEIAAERVLKLTIIKNQPLRKYNRQLLKETPSFFTNLYDKEARKYAPFKIVELLSKGVNIAIGHTDSLGFHLITLENSIFMNRLISSCGELKESIIRVDGDKFVPAW